MSLTKKAPTLRSLTCSLPLLLLSSSAFAQFEEDVEAEQNGDTETADDEGSSADQGETESEFEDSAEAEAEVESDLSTEGGGSLFESASAGGLSTEVGGSDLSLDWGGYVRGDVYVGMQKATTEQGAAAIINAAYGEVALQPRATAGSWGAAYADIRLRYGQQLDKRDLFLDVREAYATAYLGPVELRMGKQVMVWGRADAFNPTSNIAAVDFRIRSPIEDDKRLASVGARGFLNLSPVKIEAVWVPLYQATEFPPIKVDEPYIVFADPNWPSLDVRNSLLAGKVGLELSAFEASVSYLYGLAPMPGLERAWTEEDPYGFDLEVPPSSSAEVRVRRRPYRHHVIGADFAATPGDLFGIRGEAAYRMPIGYQTRNYAARPDIQWVLGLDKEFGPVMILAQYMGRYTMGWEPARPSGGSIYDTTNKDTALPYVEDALFNQNRILFSQLYRLQTLFSGRIEWKTLHDTLSLSALGMYNINTREWAVMPKVAYQITGGLTTYIGAEIYSGPQDTLFDKIEDSLTAGYAELRLTF